MVRIGITDYAQGALGDIVYVTLPDVGETVNAGAAMGELESTKSVSDICPHRRNRRRPQQALDSSPELCNTDPYGEGWLVELQLSDASPVGGPAVSV